MWGDGSVISGPGYPVPSDLEVEGLFAKIAQGYGELVQHIPFALDARIEVLPDIYSGVGLSDDFGIPGIP